MFLNPMAAEGSFQHSSTVYHCPFAPGTSDYTTLFMDPTKLDQKPGEGGKFLQQPDKSVILGYVERAFDEQPE